MVRRPIPAPAARQARSAREGEAVEDGPLPESPLAHHQAAQAQAVDQGGEDECADGQQRCPTGLDPGQGHPGVEVERGQAVGEFPQLPGRELHLVDRGRGRRSGWRPVEPHGQAGQRPDGATAGDHPVTRRRGRGQHVGDRPGALRGQAGDGGALGAGQPVTRVQLAPDAGRAQGHAGHRRDRVDGPDAGLQAPATEVESEDRLVADPDARPLAEEAQSCLLLAA